MRAERYSFCCDLAVVLVFVGESIHPLVRTEAHRLRLLEDLDETQVVDVELSLLLGDEDCLLVYVGPLPLFDVPYSVEVLD